MPHGIGDRNGTPLRYPQKRKPLKTRGIDDRFQIADECFEGNIVNVPVREPIAPLVIPDQQVILRKLLEQMTPNGALPIILEVV